MRSLFIIATLALGLALNLTVAPPASAQDVWDLDFEAKQKQEAREAEVFVDMAEAKELAREFTLRNKPLANAKVAQLGELNDYLLSVGVAYHPWNYQSWVLDIEERIVSGAPSCQGCPSVPGPCVAMRPGYNLPSDENGVYVYGLVKGYVSVAGGGVAAQPSVTGNAFTAVLHKGQQRCLAATTIGLWSEELRAKTILPINVLVDGTHTFFVKSGDLDGLPESSRQGFLQRFESLGGL